MGLHQNGFRDNVGVFRYAGATISNGAYPSALPINTHLTGAGRNFRAGQAITDRLASIPSGARPPYVWQMAQESGAIKSFRRAAVQIDALAVGEKGLPRTASATITITGTAAGGLIVGATGTATLSIGGNVAIVATLNATGTATVTITGAAVMGALASLVGTGPITIDASAQAMGLGYMTGTTEEAGLTPSGIARAVWDSLAASFNTAGTMGEKLNDAGSASNPWTEIIESGLSAAEILRLIAAAMAGKVSGAGTTSITFRDLADTKNRIVATVDSVGNRTAVTKDAS